MPQCPIECNSTQFVFDLSSYAIIGDLYADAIKQNLNISSDFLTKQINAYTAKESVTRIIIYYDSLSVSITSESPQMDIANLIATIGGNLGLFLGVSLLSLSEVFTTLFEAYFMRREKLNRIQHVGMNTRYWMSFEIINKNTTLPQLNMRRKIQFFILDFISFKLII